MKILSNVRAGDVGSVLVPELFGKGHEVIVFDNYILLQLSLLDCCMCTNILKDLNKVVCLSKGESFL